MNNTCHPKNAPVSLSTRTAGEDDYEFLFQLKKAAEFGPISAVFGWDEALQREFHHDEWSAAKPEVICVNGQRAGSYLVEERNIRDKLTNESYPELYFCRFFLLPEFQGKGIGSAILARCVAQADRRRNLMRLCYLQGNRVGELYQRFGFEIENQDTQFVYMVRQPAT